jgi:tRNA (guanine-N7-)-methyltransferase
MKLAPATIPSTDPAHLARMAERRAELAASLATVVPAGVRFVLEIGCGHGHFLTAYAKVHPAENCVGIDLIRERIERAERKRERAGLANLRFVRAEARMFLDALPPGAALAAVFVLFPDPWPKRRHHKHRLLDEEFFHALAARAGEGTPFFFRTDHGPYFQAAEAVLRVSADWRLVPGEPWPFEHTTVFQQRASRHFSLVARRR